MRCVVVLIVAMCALTASAYAESSPKGWPLSNAGEVLLAFGATYVDHTGRTLVHRGIDLKAAPGSTVHAIHPGIVRFAGSLPAGPGLSTNGVTIESEGAALRISYLPLARIDVQVGTYVDAGSVIGTIADHGGASSTEAHLHVGARKGGLYVDPMSYLAPPSLQVVPPDDDGMLFVTEEPYPPLAADPSVAVGAASSVGDISVPSAGGISAHALAPRGGLAGFGGLHGGAVSAPAMVDDQPPPFRSGADYRTESFLQQTAALERSLPVTHDHGGLAASAPAKALGGPELGSVDDGHALQTAGEVDYLDAGGVNEVLVQPLVQPFSFSAYLAAMALLAAFFSFAHGVALWKGAFRGVREDVYHDEDVAAVTVR